MKDQSQMKKNQPMMMNQKPRILNQPPPQLMNMNPQTLMMNQPPPPQQQQQVVQGMAQPPQQQMMNQRSYGMWPPPPMDMMNFPNPMQQQGFAVPKPPRNWKGKKGIDKRRKEKPMMIAGGSSSSSGGSNNVGPPPVAVGGGGGPLGGGGGYQPPTLNELQHQNRVKTKRFYPKKKFNRYAPYAHAPRNTTSFIIRAKKSGGIASLVSPYPVTPAVLPTPIFSPSREVLGDTAKEEWGVDGYGSMKGLIRLRSPGNEAGDGHDDDEEDEGGSSESDVEEHVEVERRLDHDLSRFEMIYPNYGVDYNNVLENRVDDQDSHIAQLEDENLILKERLFLMEREFDDLRRRLQFLERQNNVSSEFLEEVVENVSENESEGRDDAFYSREEEQDHEEVMEENNEEGGESDHPKEQHNEEDCEAPENEGVKDLLMEESLPQEKKDDNTRIQSKNDEVKDDGPETAEIAKEQSDVNVEDQLEEQVKNESGAEMSNGDLPTCQP